MGKINKFKFFKTILEGKIPLGYIGVNERIILK
jgi:hypothetical protein